MFSRIPHMIKFPVVKQNGSGGILILMQIFKTKKEQEPVITEKIDEICEGCMDPVI